MPEKLDELKRQKFTPEGKEGRARKALEALMADVPSFVCERARQRELQAIREEAATLRRIAEDPDLEEANL